MGAYILQLFQVRFLVPRAGLLSGSARGIAKLVKAMDKGSIYKMNTHWWLGCNFLSRLLREFFEKSKSLIFKRWVHTQRGSTPRYSAPVHLVDRCGVHAHGGQQLAKLSKDQHTWLGWGSLVFHLFIEIKTSSSNGWNAYINNRFDSYFPPVNPLRRASWGESQWLALISKISND